jgi:hypothetical protein
MKILKLLIPILGIFVLPLHADECIFWFNFSETDPTQLFPGFLCIGQGDTVTIHAWIYVYQPDWMWIDGMTFPIWFNTDYLGFVEAGLDENTFSNYWFKGVNCPSGCEYGSEYPDQVMWYASLSFYGGLIPDGTPYHVGWVKFYGVQNTAPFTILVDTMTYPPSNPAMVNDNTGTQICYPQWTSLVCLTYKITEGHVPQVFFLSEPKPNPFSHTTSITLGLPERGYIRVEIYDVGGRIVKNLISDYKEAGVYRFEWDGKDNKNQPLPSGVYFIRMITDKFKSTKTLLILR